jgi:hypothetical protein
MIAVQYGLEVHFVGMWRNRFAKHYRSWKQTDASMRPDWSEKLILAWLQDAKGRGRKEGFPPERRTKIVAISRESPAQSGLPVTHWTPLLLAEEAVRRGIVETISASTVSRILKKRFVAAPEPILAQRKDRRSRAIRTGS